MAEQTAPAKQENQGSGDICKCNEELLACVRAEYTALRGEVNERIGLQNGALQRVLSLFGITATIGVAFFAALVRSRSDSSGGVLLSEQEMQLLGKALWVLAWVFSLITVLLICNWVYQLWLIFRIADYFGWITRKLECTVHDTDRLLFRYTRRDLDQPWSVHYDHVQFRYLQVLVLYSFAGLSQFSLGLLGWILWPAARPVERVCGLVLGLGALIAVCVIGIVHVNLHHVDKQKATLP